MFFHWLTIRSLARGARVRFAGIVLLGAACIGAAISAATPPSIPSIPLAAEPLYARGARAKPTLTLALSVEFPTVGAQYVDVPNTNEDASYAPGNEYIGYFDAESCYSYNNHATPSLRRFDRSGPATGRTCGGTAFSGNFMNWASSSAIDILRYALTGGDRVVDTSSLTVLQRAYLPTTSPNNNTNFWNGTNFPAKKITNAVAQGAVPAAMLGTHTGDVYVANCENRIHFGTAKGGSCASPGSNSNLGITPASSSQIGTVQPYTAAPAATALTTFGGTQCAVESLASMAYPGYTGPTTTCNFTGIKTVLYGVESGAAPNGNGGIGWLIASAANGVACNLATFGSDPASGTYKKCYVRDYNAATDPPLGGLATTGSAALTSDTFFYSRVSVCGVDGSGVLTDPRADLCVRYPNGNYKPVGNLQKYSDRVRVAAFGYLNENADTNQRYGGVLRAPMKYVGPKHFDGNSNLISAANTKQEWDTGTGVFTTDPDGPSTEGKSGVINYLNLFGRTGSTLGLYKRRDPISELYYEALRYVQGLQPTNVESSATKSAVYNVTDAMKDGFPVHTSWTDPHPAVTGMTDYSCVRNNIVAIGDVNANADRYVPGSPHSSGTNDAPRSYSTSANEPDFHFWTKVVGGFESGNAVTYTDGSGTSRTTANFNTPANTTRWGMENQTVGNAGYYMAGMAYWANTHDIRGADWSDTDKRRPGMRVTTYMLDVNEFGQQTPYDTRKNNQYFLAGKYGGFKDTSTTGSPFKEKKNDGTVVDSNTNWENPSVPGEPKNYYLSSSARGVLNALNEIFENIAKEANSIAGGAVSTQRLTSVGGYIYQAQFDPADWSGNLVPYPLTLVGTDNINIGDIDDAPWTAAAKLDAKPPADRKLAVGKTSATSEAATAFLWDSLDTDTKEWLRRPPGNPTGPLDAESVGQARLNFLRGDRSQEAPAGTLRKRGNVLGDIVNSGVAYSGAPSLRIADPAYVSGFAETYKNRVKALFVGANDGMLHAFDSANGDELFGYLPSWLVPRLNALSAANYTHQPYVDASPAVAEAKVGSTWKTVLVGGTGGGGQGVFALDVSDPSAFDASKVLWEFTDRDDPALGNVVGRPAILKFKTGASTYKYFAVVASGVNNYADDGYFSTTGNPAIFLLDLAKPTATAWQVNVNYYKIEWPIVTDTMASGLINFTTRSGFADEVTQLYAGDLQGRLWKLDFAGKTTSDWTLPGLSFYKDGITPIPMYSAKDASGNRQPITMPPFLAFGPNRSTIVAFGTGKYLETGDNGGPFKAQSVYSLYDNNSGAADSASPFNAIAGRGRLQAASVASSGAITNSAFAWGRPLTDADTSKRSGWYFDMPSSATTGERQITPFTAFGTKVFSGTVIPPQTTCDAGSGRSYEIDLFTGTGETVKYDVGILGEPFVLAVGSDALTKSNSLDQATRTTKGRLVLQGSSALKNVKATEAVASVFRMSWRQINNYQELKAAP